ncbi:glycerophosphodiester phosphodiesterase [Cohnella sp.]|uniref:glycerophosphodiester phosphodiesterase n=1 Tax=Cohnella sp. TaxID=1883426 RepID=UPI0035648C33
MWRIIKGLRNVAFRFPTKGMSNLDKSTYASIHPCVAHRGFSGSAPENTLAAFKLALSQPFVQWMELDVHLSSDDIPVVIHDGTLKRTTNGQGEVREKTAEELGSLDAGSWFHPSFAAEGVPTLAKVLALTAGKCRMNVELKGSNADWGLLARQAVDVIRSLQLEQDTVITSFHPDILIAVRNYFPAMNIGLIAEDRPPNLVSILKELGAYYLSIDFRYLNAQLLKETAEAGISVMAWTVNSKGDLRRLAKRPEPFQLCTNYPDRWHAVMKEES